jgi:hypothetical protein
MSIITRTKAVTTALAASTALTGAAFAQYKTIQIATHYNEQQMAPLTE